MVRKRPRQLPSYILALKPQNTLINGCDLYGPRPALPLLLVPRGCHIQPLPQLQEVLLLPALVLPPVQEVLQNVRRHRARHPE